MGYEEDEFDEFEDEEEEDVSGSISLTMRRCKVCDNSVMTTEETPAMNYVCDDCKAKGKTVQVKVEEHINQVKCKACGFLIVELHSFQNEGIKVDFEGCGKCGKSDLEFVFVK